MIYWPYPRCPEQGWTRQRKSPHLWSLDSSDGEKQNGGEGTNKLSGSIGGNKIVKDGNEM